MLSNQKVKQILDEIQEIARVEMALYNAEGKLLTENFTEQEELSPVVFSFVSSMAESQTAFGFHFFKVSEEGETRYILAVKAQAEGSYVIGKLAASQIRHAVELSREQLDKNHFMQNILLGNMLVVDLYNKAKRLHIEQVRRVVFVIEVEGKKEPSVLELVKSMFGSPAKDFVTEVDEQSVVLIKDMREEDENSLVKIARMMVDNLHSEAMVRVRVGYGNCVTALQDITKSYQEAKLAIEVGKVFYPKEETFSYSSLGIGRLIYQIPMSLCKMFIREIFGEEVPDVFSEENMVTIETFFENNLNISETARQLFVHRNTLVYRLERLEKLIGLDIRKFEDAMTFKIALMVLSHMRYQTEHGQP